MYKLGEGESARRSNRLGTALLSMGIITFVLGVLFSFVLRDDLKNSVVQLYFIVGAFCAIIGAVLKRRARRVLPVIKRNNTAPSISKAPGSRLLVLVEYLYSSKTVEEVFKPIVADWRAEYFDALKEGKTKKAAWIGVRYIFSFSMAMGLSKVLSVIRSVAHR